MQHLMQYATRKFNAQDRHTTYTWRSARQELVNEYGDKVGGQVKLSLWHDKDSKEFKATMQFMNYENSRGYFTESYTLYDRVNYPFASILTQKVARYSESAFLKFENDTLKVLTVSCTENDAVRELYERITCIAMGGHGVREEYEALSM